MTPIRSFLAAAIVVAPMLACTTETAPPPPAAPSADEFVGKWNIRITDADDTFVGAQIDVEKNGDGLAAGLVWRWASYGPATKAWVEDGVLYVTRKAEAEEGEEPGEDVFEARLVDGALKGTARYPDGTVHHFQGRPAPTSPRTGEPEWGEPVTLFDGKTLDGWSLRDPKAKMGWAVVDGELAVVESKDNADLVSDQVFQDMKLHLEFNVEPKSNSGVYLRGRYEIQILDNPEMTGDTHGAGALYSRIAPSEGRHEARRGVADLRHHARRAAADGGPERHGGRLRHGRGHHRRRDQPLRGRARAAHAAGRPRQGPLPQHRGDSGQIVA